MTPRTSARSSQVMALLPTLFGQAVQLTPEGHPNTPGRLISLGNTYQSRFDGQGNISDIHEAIACRSRAAQLISEAHEDYASLLESKTLRDVFSYGCVFSRLRPESRAGVSQVSTSIQRIFAETSASRGRRSLILLQEPWCLLIPKSD